MFSRLSLYHQIYCNMKKSLGTSSSVEMSCQCQTTLTCLRSVLTYINYPKNDFDSSATLSIRTILPGFARTESASKNVWFGFVLFFCHRHPPPTPAFISSAVIPCLHACAHSFKQDISLLQSEVRSSSLEEHQLKYNSGQKCNAAFPSNHNSKFKKKRELFSSTIWMILQPCNNNYVCCLDKGKLTSLYLNYSLQYVHMKQSSPDEICK